MRYLLLFCLIALAKSAPLDEAARVRRAQEFVMFSNQENEASDKVKRSEAGSDAEIDLKGSVMSMEPKDLEPEELTSDSDEEVVDESSNNVENNVQDDSAESDTEILAPEDDSPGSEEVDEADLPEEPARLDESEEMEEKSQENLQNYYENLLPYYYNTIANQRSNGGYYDMYPQYPFIRKRRSRERIFLGDNTDRFRILKRNRRIKRDLIYPSESLVREYPYVDEYPRGGSNGYNEVVDYLMDLLDERYNEEPAYNTPYGYDEEPYELAPYEGLEDTAEDLMYPGYGEQELEEAMAKRQAGLTFVPGFKRNNFYPYFEEPESHFGAFVPEKRSSDEYADAYRRVMGLASALRENNYYPGNYRYEDFGYRRK